MTDYQYAWLLYLIGATGCSLAAWLLFRRAGRAVTHFFVITVMVILFTPYAIDPQTMTMAPAVYTLLFGYMDGGFIMIKPVIKLMLGIWIGTLILSLIYQLLTRGRAHAGSEQHAYHRSSRNQAYDAHEEDEDYHYAPTPRRSPNRSGLSLEERIARSELLHEEPIRAIR
ncbi:MAG TPA: hypothetical protein VLC79_03675 [Cellvibrio sp.]|nr:hypothetical protein [Cellvibrio sp.]